MDFHILQYDETNTSHIDFKCYKIIYQSYQEIKKLFFRSTCKEIEQKQNKNSTTCFSIEK